MFFTGNVPTAPIIDETEGWRFPDYSPQPTYTDEHWGNFDATFDPFTPYIVEAYTDQALYTPQPVTIAPSQIHPAPATADTPPAQAGSPGGCSHGSSDGSEDGSPRGERSTRYVEAGFGHGTTRRPRRTNRHIPYSISERPSISRAKYTPSTSTDSDSDEAFSPAPVFTFDAYRSPKDAAYLDSKQEKIQDELDLLSRKLGQLGRKGFKHHPYMTCPVFDCEKGGFNELLHGSTSALPTTITTRRSASSSTPRSLNKSSPISPASVVLNRVTDTGTKSSAYQATGPFSAFNEISRHVTSIHMSAVDLRCSYPGCRTQTKLDSKPGGKKRFSRADTLKTHLKNEKDHRSHIPDEVRSKYKLW